MGVRNKEEDTKRQNNSNVRDFETIKRKKWRKGKKGRGGMKSGKKRSIAKDFAARKVPFIYYKTEFETWNARTKPWNGDYFRKKEVKLDGIYVKENNPHFGPYFDLARPYNKLKTVAPKHLYNENYTMKMNQFIDHVEGQQDRSTAHETEHHRFYYLSKEIDKIDANLISDIYPYHELLRLNPQKTSVNCWIGQSGVVTPCHYDGYHNIYVQLSGYKMFYLLPPSGRNFVRPYPFLHPSQAQCQLADYMFRHNSKQA